MKRLSCKNKGYEFSFDKLTNEEVEELRAINTLIQIDGDIDFMYNVLDEIYWNRSLNPYLTQEMVKAIEIFDDANTPVINVSKLPEPINIKTTITINITDTNG